MAKKRPAMSLELSAAKSAAEVAEIIGNAWIGYGLGDIKEGDGDSVTIELTTQPKTWKGAQKALWLKPKAKKGNETVYRMFNMDYELAVTADESKGEDKDTLHTILIRPITEVTTKEFSPYFNLIRLLHMAGQHNQLRHGSRYGSVAKVKRSLGKLADDPEAKQGYREQAVEQVKKYKNLVDMYGEEGARKLNSEQNIAFATPMDNVMSAITNSKAYQRLEEEQGKKYTWTYEATDWSAPKNPDGSRPKYKKELEGELSASHGRYLQQPKEAFARAYSQYVAVKSSDPKIKEELRVRQAKASKDNDFSDHWQDDDFKPIEKALDDFFIGLGLAKEYGS